MTIRCIAAVATLTAGIILSPATARATDYELTVSANRDHIYLGESLILTVRVGGSTRPPPPDLSAIDGFQIDLLGSHPRSHRSISIVNGKLTQTGFSGREYTYRLTPGKAGSFRLGPVRLTDGGKRVEATGPRVSVSGVEEQDWVRIAVDGSRDAVLVGEAFEITVTIALKALAPPYAQHHPLDPESVPALSIPFLEWTDVKGLELPDTRTMLQDMLVSRRDQPAFSINDYTVRSDPFDSPFSFTPFADPMPARFMAGREQGSGALAGYHLYRMPLTYTPTREGQHTFGPITFKGPVITGVAAGGRISRTPVFAVGPAYTVRVVPPPEEGRPVSYIGAIGSNLVVTSELDTQTCMVGDPLTLRVTVDGDARLGDVRAPDLSRQADIGERFRLYMDTVETRDSDTGGKVFRYTLRPTQDGTYEFPPVRVAYYDSVSRAYREVASEPIPMRVNRAVDVRVDDIINAATGATSRIVFAAGSATQPAGITAASAGYRAVTFAASAPVRITLCSGPIAILLVLLLKGIGRLTRSPANRQRRAALPQALRVLRLIDRRASAAEAAEAAAAAMRAFIAARFGVPDAGLTPDRLREVLARQPLPQDRIDAFARAYDRVFNAAFAPAAKEGVTDMLDACIAATEGLARESRTPRAARATQLPTLLFMLWVPASWGADALERQFLWEEANARAATAVSSEDFLASADAYRDLILTGVRNAALFYNYGTVLLAAGETDAAWDALLRAERYAGADPDIRQNLGLCRTVAADGSMQELPWYRIPLFWHYGLSLEVRLTACAAGLALLCFALSLRLMGGRRSARLTAIAALLLLAHFGSSVAASRLAEEHADDALRRSPRWLETRNGEVTS